MSFMISIAIYCRFITGDAAEDEDSQRTPVPLIFSAQ